jgi:hypothetical protein
MAGVALYGFTDPSADCGATGEVDDVVLAMSGAPPSNRPTMTYVFIAIPGS